MKANKIYSTDWLSSKPVFYNTKTKKISKNIHDVIDYANLEFDNEGLKNYLEFGYSVFSQTPIKDVCFLSHSSTISYNRDKKIVITANQNDIESELNKDFLDEEYVIQKITDSVQSWEKKQKTKIIIPTSGGYDSRLLNSCIKNKENVYTFTYGASTKQEESYEVVYAQYLSQTLNTHWQQINLGNFHSYFNTWDELFGVSTHAHGMYQIDFYSKIKNILCNQNFSLLSGIIGDAWSDRNKLPPIESVKDLNRLGYTHDMHADPDACLLKSSPYKKNIYYKKNKKNLKDERLRTIEAMRLKMILLNYLFKVPEYYGFDAWSPFLDPEIALSMMRIHPERREKRIWQTDYFKKNNLFFENLNLKINKFNTLNTIAINKYPLEPLSTSKLKEIINVQYIEWINQNLQTASITMKLTQYLLNQRVLNVVLPSIGITNSQLTAYYAYLTLLPLQKAINKSQK